MAGIDWLRALPWLAVVAALAATGAWLAGSHARRHGLLDLPGERRSHAEPTPRGGGIGIVVAWALACGMLGILGTVPGALALAALVGTLLVGGAGYADDHRPLSPWWRLATHIGAGAVLAAALGGSGAAPWLVVLAFAGVPVLVNVWNFMDGINGLAASQAALCALGFALLSGTPATGLPAMVLLAACLGFLPFNFPRARIFLGDVGSGVLGFALAWLAGVLLLAKGEGAGRDLLPLLFLLLSAFLVDASLTLLGRIVRREQWWSAHVWHAYQRMAARVGSHVPVTLAYAGWTAAAVFLATTAERQGFATKLALAGGCAAVGTLVWRVATGAQPRHQKERP
jgi:UDP-N-acetylmuramyl pentapeptide phosphotransferase/UDP-N-acetylglucosamine-1-phosphate transferase